MKQISLTYCLFFIYILVPLANATSLKFLKKLTTTSIASLILGCNSLNHNIVISNAAVMDDPESIKRLEASRDQLTLLDKDWNNIVTKGGGDEVRRYLGTVYGPSLPKSPLSSMPLFVEKFIKSHSNDLNLSEFEEPSAEFLQSLTQADFLAYSANFAEFSAAAGIDDSPNSPKQLLIKSHTAVKKAQKSLDEMLLIINSE